MEKKLTLKQEKFVNEYLRSGHITKSAIAAGYSEKTAYSIGSETLKKPEIKLKIEEVMSEIAEQVGLTPKKVLSVLNRVLDKIEKDDDKILSPILKATELSMKHLKLLNENEIDITLKEHRDTIKKLSELE